MRKVYISSTFFATRGFASMDGNNVKLSNYNINRYYSRKAITFYNKVCIIYIADIKC